MTVMSGSDTDSNAFFLQSGIRDVKLEPHAPTDDGDTDMKASMDDDGTACIATEPRPHTPVKVDTSGQPPAVEASKPKQSFANGTARNLEPGKGPRLARSTSHNVAPRQPPLFMDYNDCTDEAKSMFDVIDYCTYANKGLGSTEHALECDCADEWDAESKKNLACGEDSDCINRATKMECIADCGCGSECQNQRFSRKQYANVAVFKTEKKGYGLRANTDLRPNDFIYEYIGEVINERTFRIRMAQYDQERIKHFYFMSLSKGEFVDATKRGNLGRFCNHSCNPNCFVDKWVVGDKLRMGIFAERAIKAGEELVFNYNVDRYGAQAQACFCGEVTCTGFIGGKTQTGNAIELSHATIEALGIDVNDGWHTAVAKKPRKKKLSNDGDSYGEQGVRNVSPRSLDEGGVTKVMATLMQCKEEWIVVKLLSRIQGSDDEKVMNRIVRMHGYRILKTTLDNFMDNHNVVLQVLDILNRMPRLSRNKIQNSDIEKAIERLTACDADGVSSKASQLLHEWSQLKMEYRIPRAKREQGGPSAYDSRWAERTERVSKERSVSPEAPKGPSNRNLASHRRFALASRHYNHPPRFNPLHRGWLMDQDNTKRTHWKRPAATLPPASRVETKSRQQMVQDILRDITDSTPKAQSSGAATPGPDSTKDGKNGVEKWRSYNIEKRKKVYENTIFPYICDILNEFTKHLSKEDLKRLSKELSKKIVNTDYQEGRVDDPTRITKEHARGIQKYVRKTLCKVCAKKGKSSKKADGPGPGSPGDTRSHLCATNKIDVTSDAHGGARPKDTVLEGSSGHLTKRKRHERDRTLARASLGAEGNSSCKRQKQTDTDSSPPSHPSAPPSDSTNCNEPGDALAKTDTPTSSEQAAAASSLVESAIDSSARNRDRCSTEANGHGPSVGKDTAVEARTRNESNANKQRSPIQASSLLTSHLVGNFDGMHSDRRLQLLDNRP